MNKFFATKLFVIRKFDGTYKILRNKQDAEEFCDDNELDFKSCVDVFDSKKEFDRYHHLKKLEEDGTIHDLKRQVEFLLIPAHYEDKVVGTKRKRCYMVNGLVFDKRKDAENYRLEKGMHKKDVTIEEATEQVVKKICVEKESVYTADFTYTLNNGEYVVEDVKSAYTRKEADYVLRRKLMLHVHGIKIKEYD